MTSSNLREHCRLTRTQARHCQTSCWLPCPIRMDFGFKALLHLFLRVWDKHGAFRSLRPELSPEPQSLGTIFGVATVFMLCHEYVLIGTFEGLPGDSASHKACPCSTKELATQAVLKCQELLGGRKDDGRECNRLHHNFLRQLRIALLRSTSTCSLLGWTMLLSRSVRRILSPKPAWEAHYEGPASSFEPCLNACNTRTPCVRT